MDRIIFKKIKPERILPGLMIIFMSFPVNHSC